MADITFDCPQCKQRLEIDAGNAGVQITCPTCARKITVPQTNGASLERQTANSDVGVKSHTSKMVLVMVSTLLLFILGISYWYFGVHLPYESKLKQEQEEARMHEDQQKNQAEEDKKTALEMDRRFKKFNGEMQGKLAQANALKKAFTDSVEQSDETNTKKNLAEWRARAAQGDADAQVAVGMGFFLGDDYKSAVVWFGKAAAQGHAAGEYWLGRCYFYGMGVPQNRSQGVRLWALSANQGDQFAEYCLGGCYLLGTGVPKNLNTGVIWLRKSADQGDPEAKETLKQLGLN